jgi:hypothetical protein
VRSHGHHAELRRQRQPTPAGDRLTCQKSEMASKGASVLCR